MDSRVSSKAGDHTIEVVPRRVHNGNVGGALPYRVNPKKTTFFVKRMHISGVGARHKNRFAGAGKVRHHKAHRPECRNRNFSFDVAVVVKIADMPRQRRFRKRRYRNRIGTGYGSVDRPILVRCGNTRPIARQRPRRFQIPAARDDVGTYQCHFQPDQVSIFKIGTGGRRDPPGSALRPVPMTRARTRFDSSRP